MRKQRGEGWYNCTLTAATGLIFVQVVKRDISHIDGESLLDKWVASWADGTNTNESYCFHMGIFVCVVETICFIFEGFFSLTVKLQPSILELHPQTQPVCFILCLCF